MYYNKVGGDAFVALLKNNEKVGLGHLRFLQVSSDSAASEQIAQRLKNMEIDKDLLSHLVDMAKASPRLRHSHDLRTSRADNSQRMLCALLPGTDVPIHRHPQSTETVVVLCGKLVEVIYNDGGREVERISLDPLAGKYGCVVPKGAWHTVVVLEPSVIFEAKDGGYGVDGSEVWSGVKDKTDFSNCLGDLKKNVEYLIGMERQQGAVDVSPEYIARVLNVPVEEVIRVMEEMA
mgnify:FL=1